MKNFKFVAAVTLMTIMVLLSVTTAFAATPAIENYAEVMPFWDNTSDVNPSLSISGSTATCSAVVEGYSGTTKIVADITLERKNANGTYAVVKTWTNQSISSIRFLFSDTCAIITGYTYRLTVTAKVTRNGTTETVSNWIEKAS